MPAVYAASGAKRRSFVCRDDSSELEKLLRHFRVERRIIDLGATTLSGLAPALAERLEELVHQARNLASALRTENRRSRTVQVR